MQNDNLKFKMAEDSRLKNTPGVAPIQSGDSPGVKKTESIEYISENLLQTKILGGRIASQLKGGEVLCLYGDLGAGKTTFIRGLIDFFLPGKRVLSPTFIIVRHYHTTHPLIKNIYHVDLYRISKVKEIASLGISEFVNKLDTVVAVEWAEKLGSLLPEKRIDISFSIIDEDKRGIKITTK